jgi:hypothetical protein
MSKKVTVTYTITYDFTQGEIAEDYLEQLMDYEDTKEQRKWYALDLFIGEDNMELIDKAATLTVTEE